MVSKLKLALFLIGISALLLVACTNSASPTTTTTTEPTTTTPVQTVSETDGKTLYSKKCAVCHGLDAEGTTIGPDIAGHSISPTMMQVRNPMGTMPAFSNDQLSDSDLDKIAEFIASLGKTEAPLDEWEKATTETMHDWLALLAIQNDDVEDARHHLQDALAFVKEPMHKTATEEALSLIAQGNLHDAEHEIEEMAGSEAPSGITRQKIHLLLAQRGVQAENAAEAKHHLEHFLVKATEPERTIAQEALELIEKADFHEAEHEVEELLAEEAKM